MKNQIEKKYHVFHHNDMDGHSSGALVALGLIELGIKREVIHFYRINYGEKFDDSKINYDTDVVYMVDFTLQPSEKMWELKKKLDNRFIWIDHHKTSRVLMEEEGFKAEGIIDDGPQAACSLVWRWFWPDKPEPKAIKMISQYDVWNKDGEFEWYDCLCLQSGLYARETEPGKDLDFWESITKGPEAEGILLGIFGEGKMLKENNDRRQKSISEKMAYEGTFEGHKAIVMNTAEAGSIQFEVAHDVSQYDIMVTYRNMAGKYWIVGLYSTNPEMDCGALAKRLGAEGPFKSGGGHPGAAGFQTDTEHLLKIMPGFKN